MREGYEIYEAYLDGRGPWAIEILEELDDDDVQPIRGDVARGVKVEAPKIY